MATCNNSEKYMFLSYYVAFDFAKTDDLNLYLNDLRSFSNIP